MKKMRRVLKMPPCTHLSCVLMLLLLLGRGGLSVCPPMCSCARGHRTVDCSGRGLSLLPDGLQHNIRALNLSRNRLHDLDGKLAHFTHLRALDLSHNRLSRLPAGLPRALWDVHAAGNRLRQLEKNDTAYHWNLRALDLSANQLERVVFINNTLTGLLSLNLSHNKFWTVPTNMPTNLETVDLSHNYLVQILPGSLDRMGRLAQLYLHGNRFAAADGQAFAKLHGLRLLTLYDNPWACEDAEGLRDLLDWMRLTSARILGCPCHTHPVCGEAHLTSTGSWHYTLHPAGADTRRARPSRPPMQAVTSGFLSKSALVIPDPTRPPPGPDGNPAPSRSHHPSLTSTPPTFSTRMSTTPRPRRAGKAGGVGGEAGEGGAGLGVARSRSDGLKAPPPSIIALTVFLTVISLKKF
ncbi:oligodendrocyte-myelin glycoprotein [Anguilla rostrata]|uniref:oligodendrocyte-myelin glycoprotein n=1 Tax=Anguilla rostrata TaxID=7938 RepID=UPI0030D2AF86